MATIGGELRGIMNDLDDTRHIRLPRKPVFVDWRGARRRAVVAAGIAAGVALSGWLTLIVASFVTAIITGPSLPGSG
ncbi:hypothetical protein [Actinoplanes sp. NPDC026619]|uniref:hypothetical protein n=1 Tax=Actinoplanes sp. NPDC026619 TaxID=3155798 RepID=UPI0033DFC329